MNLSPRQLRIFVLLADSLSFRHTAEHLHVTQPTLSRLVKEIEDIAGVRLFERTTRMVRLSRDGRDILETARRLVAQHDSGMRELTQRLRERHQRVSIAALPTLAASLLPQLIHELRQQAPRAQLEVRDSIAGEALALLRERRVDVAITARGDQRPADLLYEELFSEPFVLFHSAAIAAPLRHWDTAKLGRLPLISMLPGTSVRELTESVFQKEAQRFEPMYSLRDLGAIARFVQANCGIALLPESAVDYSALRGVRKTRLKNAPTRSIGLFIRQGEPCGRLLQTTLQALRELGRARQHEP